MPVEGNTQPYGLWHGGASGVLAETLASIASYAHAQPGGMAVGVDLNVTHHRPARAGRVTGVATALHLGRRVTSYEVVITHESGVRVATARVTCHVLRPGHDDAARRPRHRLASARAPGRRPGVGPGPAGGRLRGQPDHRRRSGSAWDPFIREQHLIGADRPGKDVRTFTRARVGPVRGFAMVSRYVSYAPAHLGRHDDGARPVVLRPLRRAAGASTPRPATASPARPRPGSTPTPSGRACSARVAEPIGQRLLGREIRARIDAFARACTRPRGTRAPRSRQVGARAQGCCATARDLTQEILSWRPITMTPRRSQGHNDR